MNFSEALKAPTVAERDRLIEAEIHENAGDFDDMLDGDDMQYGGFPDDVLLEHVTIHGDGSDLIVVTVDVQFVESVAIGCKDINMEHPGTAEFRLTIDKATGKVEFDDDPENDISSANDDDEEMEVHEDDYK